MEKISDRLNYALHLRNMKPIELSEKTGIDKGSISSYLSGRYLPKSKRIYKMAKALSVDPVWLLGYDVPIEQQLTTININDKIVLWDDLFGYKENDEINFKTFCESVSFYYSLLVHTLGTIEEILPTLYKLINNSNINNQDIELSKNTLTTIHEIYALVIKKETLISNNKDELTLGIIKFFKLLKENEILLHEAFDIGKISKDDYEKELESLNEKFSENSDYVEGSNTKYKINIPNDEKSIFKNNRVPSIKNSENIKKN